LTPKSFVLSIVIVRGSTTASAITITKRSMYGHLQIGSIDTPTTRRIGELMTFYVQTVVCILDCGLLRGPGRLYDTGSSRSY